MMTRRAALQRVGLWSVFAAGAWPGSQRADDAPGTDANFRFHILNDLHHATTECDPWFAAVVAKVKADPDHEFALLLGDLSDEAKPASFATVKDLFGGLGRPYHVLIGNHDQKTDATAEAFDAAFPGQRNYWFEHRGWQFVGIDSTQGTAASDTRVSERTLGWLDQTLPKLDRRRPTVLYSHFPLGKGVKMTPLNADDVLGRFLEHNLQGVFSGHYHAYTEKEFHGAPVITNRCCSRLRGNHDGSKEKGWWSMAASAGRLSKTFVEFKG